MIELRFPLDYRVHTHRQRSDSKPPSLSWTQDHNTVSHSIQPHDFQIARLGHHNQMMRYGRRYDRPISPQFKSAFPLPSENQTAGQQTYVVLTLPLKSHGEIMPFIHKIQEPVKQLLALLPRQSIDVPHTPANGEHAFPSSYWVGAHGWMNSCEL